MPDKISFDACNKTPRKRYYLFILILVLTVVPLSSVLGISGYVGWDLTHPIREPLDSNPLEEGLPYQDVSFTSRGDGLELKGWFIPAPGSDETIIFAHGYGNNRLQSNVPLMAIVKEVVSQGYNVLMFDFRNSGESAGTMTSVGQYETQDLLGAVDFIKSQPQISKQIILFGFSMGAATSILTGAREPAVTAVIADCPFADLKSYLSKNLSVWSDLPSVPFNQAFFIVVPPMVGLEAEGVSPLKEVAALDGRPLLLIHGEADVDIPIENSEMLQQAYQQAQLLRIPGAGHVQSYATDPVTYMATVNSFLSSL